MDICPYHVGVRQYLPTLIVIWTSKSYGLGQRYKSVLLFLLISCRTIDEAIQKANSTRYGLVAGIITKDLNVVNTVSRSIRAGTIWVNCYFAFDNDCPYGGYKMSGFGRDSGLEAFHKYL